eukprot:755015-Hanusia_phi.AAC.1
MHNRYETCNRVYFSTHDVCTKCKQMKTSLFFLNNVFARQELREDQACGSDKTPNKGENKKAVIWAPLETHARPGF